MASSQAEPGALVGEALKTEEDVLFLKNLQANQRLTLRALRPPFL